MPKERNPKEKIDALIDRFTPEVASMARRALAKMRKLTPGSLELVYDNYNALAIGFSPTERAGDGIFSIAVFPGHPSLFFLQGAKLPDPTKRLREGEGAARPCAAAQAHHQEHLAEATPAETEGALSHPSGDCRCPPRRHRAC